MTKNDYVMLEMDFDTEAAAVDFLGRLQNDTWKTGVAPRSCEPSTRIIETVAIEMVPALAGTALFAPDRRPQEKPLPPMPVGVFGAPRSHSEGGDTFQPGAVVAVHDARLPPQFQPLRCHLQTGQVVVEPWALEAGPAERRVRYLCRAGNQAPTGVARP